MRKKFGLFEELHAFGKDFRFFFSRLGHACDLVLNYMTKMPGYGLVAFLRPLGHRRTQGTFGNIYSPIKKIKKKIYHLKV